MAVIQFILQDEEARSVLGLLQCASPVDGPLKRALDALDRGLKEATTDRWVKLAKGDWADHKGTSLRVEVVKTLRAITPGLALKEAADMAQEFETGRWLPAEKVQHLNALFPGLLSASMEAPDGALNVSDDDLLAYYNQNPTAGFLGNTCERCRSTVNVPSLNLKWTCPCGHVNNTVSLTIHAHPTYGPSGARVQLARDAKSPTEADRVARLATESFGLDFEPADIASWVADQNTPAVLDPPPSPENGNSLLDEMV